MSVRGNALFVHSRRIRSVRPWHHDFLRPLYCLYTPWKLIPNPAQMAVNLAQMTLNPTQMDPNPTQDFNNSNVSNKACRVDGLKACFYFLPVLTVPAKA